MALYFAFGLTLDPARMSAVCPKARRIDIGRLPRHRLVVLQGGQVSLVRDPRREVLGLVYDVPFGELKLLDRLEGRAQKLNQPIILPDGAKRALLHIAQGVGTAPSPSDRQILAKAARSGGLSENYIYEIEHGEPAPRKPGMPLFKAPVPSVPR
jgi:gamma-glutamylcyclotransferase (GGCT)/AIG2-like uncharacterized protein YtfP